MIQLENTQLFKNHKKSPKEIELKSNLRDTLEKKKKQFQDGLDRYLELDISISAMKDTQHRARQLQKQRDVAYSNKCIDADINELIVLIR